MADAGPENDHPEWSRLMAAAQDGDGVAYEPLLREVTPLRRTMRRAAGAHVVLRVEHGRGMVTRRGGRRSLVFVIIGRHTRP